MESQKYRSQFSTNPPLTLYPGVDAVGTNLALSGLWNPSGLVGYWNFEEGSGSSTVDQSGNGSTGTWHGTPAGNKGTYYTGGKIGSYAGYFDGSDNVVNFTSPPPASGDRTISAWINATTTAVRNWIAGTRSGTYGGFSIETTGKLCYMDDISAQVCLASPLISTNVWHFVSVTISGSNVGFSVDGISAMYTDSHTMSFTGLRIGSRGDNYAYFNGLIDDVRIYNRALSPAEIQALYNAQK